VNFSLAGVPLYFYCLLLTVDCFRPPACNDRFPAIAAASAKAILTS
jgi:hypothetical protein